MLDESTDASNTSLLVLYVHIAYPSETERMV